MNTMSYIPAHVLVPYDTDLTLYSLSKPTTFIANVL